MQKQDGDINMLISPSSLLSAYANPLNYGISHNIDLKDLKMLGSLSFEKRKIELKVESYTENTELKALFRKANQKYLSHRKHVLEVFPKIYPGAIQHRYQWRKSSTMCCKRMSSSATISPLPKAAEVKDLFSAFHNDLTIGLINVTMNSNPSFLAYASVRTTLP